MDISIERLCIENGLKMTGPRRVIARVLSEATDHPDVEELHRRANRVDNRISLATVYRTVRLLEAKGILSRLRAGCRQMPRISRNAQAFAAFPVSALLDHQHMGAIWLFQ